MLRVSDGVYHVMCIVCCVWCFVYYGVCFRSCFVCSVSSVAHGQYIAAYCVICIRHRVLCIVRRVMRSVYHVVCELQGMCHTLL